MNFVDSDLIYSYIICILMRAIFSLINNAFAGVWCGSPPLSWLINKTTNNSLEQGSLFTYMICYL